MLGRDGRGLPPVLPTKRGQAKALPVDLDDLDRRILRALQTDNVCPLPNSPASGFVRGLVSAAREQAEGEPRDPCRCRTDRSAMVAAPEVIQCYVVTGDADFVMIVTVEDGAADDDFGRTKLYTNPNVRKFRSMVVLDSVKVDPRVQV